MACVPVSNRTCLAFAKATQMKISDLPHLHVYCLLCHTWEFVDLMDRLWTTFMLALEHGGVHIPSLEVLCFSQLRMMASIQCLPYNVRNLIM